MNIDVNKLQRNHYVPQFYLREWYDPDLNKVWLYFRDERGKIRQKQRSSKSVGYTDGLYALLSDGLSLRNSVSNQIEDSFFSAIDNSASIIHRKLITLGVRSLSTDERVVWALFVVSLLERTPKRLKEMESKFAHVPGEAIAELECLSPSLANRPWFRALNENMNPEAMVHNAVLKEMTQCISDDQFIKQVSELQWLTVDLPKGKDHFLTGDTPILINNGDSSDDIIYMLSLAISPDRLLVMHLPTLELDAELLSKIALCHNILVAKKAVKYLISSRMLEDSEFIKYSRIAETILSPLVGVNS